MPKFKVCLRQAIEKVAYVDLEADTPGEAAHKINRAHYRGANWSSGKIMSKEVCTVENENGELVWMKRYSDPISS